MLLSPTPVSTERFHYDANSGTFTAEASDLGRNFQPSRVYDDACDVGFTLVSHKTGRQVIFASAGEKRDAEGELLWEDFLAVPQGAGHKAYRARVYND